MLLLRFSNPGGGNMKGEKAALLHPCRHPIPFLTHARRHREVSPSLRCSCAALSVLFASQTVPGSPLLTSSLSLGTFPWTATTNTPNVTASVPRCSAFHASLLSYQAVSLSPAPSPAPTPFFSRRLSYNMQKRVSECLCSCVGHTCSPPHWAARVKDMKQQSERCRIGE